MESKTGKLDANVPDTLFEFSKMFENDSVGKNDEINEVNENENSGNEANESDTLNQTQHVVANN